MGSVQGNVETPNVKPQLSQTLAKPERGRNWHLKIKNDDDDDVECVII